MQALDKEECRMIFIEKFENNKAESCQACGAYTKEGAAKLTTVPNVKRKITDAVFRVQFGNKERYNGAEVAICIDCLAEMQDIIKEVVQDYKTTIEYNIVCPICGDVKTLKLNKESVKRYLSGELVQVAFKDVSQDDRERIKTGICPTCWCQVMADEEEGEE